MGLASQWRELAGDLPPDWAEARVFLELDDATQADRVALILTSFQPGRRRAGFDFAVQPGRDPVRHLKRLDAEGIGGRLSVVGTEDRAAEPVSTARAEEPAEPLAAQWDALLARLPDDWNDLYVELHLDSSDYLDRGALLLSPVNPARYGGPSAFRFRVAAAKGYGAAAEMTRRCFERLDAEGITGSVRVVRVLSRTAHVSTQGPVWYVEGRAV